MENVENSESFDFSSINLKEGHTIKHIVISGGGTTGITFYTVLRELAKNNFWNIENIQTMYATSIGSLISVILCLKYDWDIVDNFIIKRPWNDIFKFDLYTILQVFDKRGIFSIDKFDDLFKPLFTGCDISTDITMKDFYDINGIELHFFSTELNTFSSIDISYKTHPNMRVIEAVYCSCTLPVVFSPIFYENNCYVDGGILNDFPLNDCIENGAKAEEILAIKKRNFLSKKNITEESSFFEYILSILQNVLVKILRTKYISDIPYIIIVKDYPVSIQSIIGFSSSMEERKRLMIEGLKNVSFLNSIV